MPLFEIYRKDFRIEPRQARKPLLDMGQELVPVCRYPVAIPPVHYMPGELAAALDILPPLVVIA